MSAANYEQMMSEFVGVTLQPWQRRLAEAVLSGERIVPITSRRGYDPEYRRRMIVMESVIRHAFRVPVRVLHGRVPAKRNAWKGYGRG